MEAITWTVERRKLKSLKAFDRNPRQMDKTQEAQLSRSIERFGLAEPIVCTPGGMIIGGHQRVRVLKKRGATECDCYVPSRDLDDKEVEELCIRLNRNGGEFDYDALANDWDVHDLIDWGFAPDDFVGDDVEVAKKEPKPKVCPECGHEF